MILRVVALAALLVACGSSAPASSAECAALGAAYDTARAAGACTSDADCVEASSIERARSEDENGIRNFAVHAYPCASAAHRDQASAVEAAASAFERAQCGARVAPGTACTSGPSGHGYHPICSADHRCEAGY